MIHPAWILRRWVKDFLVTNGLGSPKLSRIVGIDQRSALMVLRRVRSGLGNGVEITEPVSRITPSSATQSQEINRIYVAENVA